MAANEKQKVTFNGINARSGSYMFDAMSAKELAKAVRGHSLDEEPGGKQHLNDLKMRKNEGERIRSVIEGVDGTKLEQAGWGVIWPATRPGTDEALEQEKIYEALSPLLTLRKAQATKLKGHYYKEFRGAQGYRPGESKQKFMARFGVGIGPADPEQIPYYLLIVASPQVIPFHVQYQLDVQYAVGRLHFETIEEYDNYARSVVAAETGVITLPREIAFIGVANPDDQATQLSREHLVAPLADKVEGWQDVKGWSVSRYFDDMATKANVMPLFGGAKTPALIFSASHGMGFDKGDPLQQRHQGALLLQDWTGPEQWRGPIDESLYLSGDDLSSDAGLHGLISFNFACYGGGTPQYDEFSKQAFKQRKEIADEAFVAGLHRKLLSHPKGGALASIGHVERAWGCSFMAETGRRGEKTGQLAVFESTLKSLLKGMPVGMAVEYFNERYAEMASDLTLQLEELEFEPDAVDPYMLASMWTSNNDARGYAILGDPAVRLRFADDGDTPALDTSVPVEIVTPTAAPRVSHQVVDEIVELLRGALVPDATHTLEVRTYVSRDVDQAAAAGPEARDGSLRALTRVALSGDVEQIVAEDGVDEAVMKLHLETVKQAQAARLEALAALRVGDERDD